MPYSPVVPGQARLSSGCGDEPCLPPLTPLKRPPSQQVVSVTETDKCRRDSDTARFLRILIAPAAIFGSSFSLALQFVLLTPLATSLGVSSSAASLVWLMGPVTGMLVQPLMGDLSDRYHRKHATRLPIVIYASSILAISHIGIAFCCSISAVVPVPPLVTLIASFWMLDAANNVITLTMRAMLSDRFGRDHRTLAFSMLQFWTSLGYIAGYFVANIDWGGGDLVHNVTCSFLCSAFTVVAGSALSAISVFEKRACRMRFHTIQTGAKFSFSSCLEPCLISILAGSILTWFGWFSQQVFQSNFVGSRVIHEPSPAIAVQVTAYGLVISSVLSCLTGIFVIPWLLAYAGTSSFILFRVWAVSSMLQGLNLLMSPFVKTIPGAVLWEASTGPMYAVSLTVPFMLVANGCDHGSSGRVMALVNVAVCIPQLFVSLGGGVIIACTRSVVAIFIIGGVLCLLATYFLWVPSGEELPGWATRSTASIIASTSDLFTMFEESEVSFREPLIRNT